MNTPKTLVEAVAIQSGSWIAVEESKLAGEMTYLSNLQDAKLPTIIGAWSKHGLDDKLLPPPPTKLRALRLALEEFQKKHVLVRPLKKDGYAIVEETELVGNLKYRELVQARIEGGTLQVEGIHSWDYERRIREGYENHLDTLPSERLSSWLWIDLAVKKCAAVSGRDTGGFYFVPRTHRAQWRQYCEAIKEVKCCKIYHVPAASSSDIVEAVMDSVIYEAEREIELMRGQLENNDKITERGLRGQGKRSKGVRSKVRHYEELFKQQLPKIQTALNELDADITSAILLENAEED